MKITRLQLFVSLFSIVFITFSENVVLLVLTVTVGALFFTNNIKLSSLRALGLNTYFLLMLVCAISTVILSPFALNPYFIGRDIFYFLSPVILLLLGFVLARPSEMTNRVIWTIVLTLTAISLFQYRDLILSGGFLSLSIATRYTYSLNSNYPVLVCVILIAAKHSSVRLGRPRVVNTLILLNIAFVVVSLSRVNIGIMLVVLMLLFIRRKGLRIGALAVTLSLILLPLISGLNAKSGISIESVGFMDKVMGSLSEMAIQDQNSLSEINLNWRGYEAFLGMDAVRQNGFWSILFGLGYGSYVEGPFEDKLNFIPIFHNGYITVYLKGGLIGILLFLLFLKKQAFGYDKVRASSLPDSQVKSILFWEKLTIVLVVSVALKTLVTHGILITKAPLELMLLGLLHGARYKMQKVPAGERSSALTSTLNKGRFSS